MSKQFSLQVAHLPRVLKTPWSLTRTSERKKEKHSIAPNQHRNNATARRTRFKGSETDAFAIPKLPGCGSLRMGDARWHGNALKMPICIGVTTISTVHRQRLQCASLNIAGFEAKHPRGPISRQGNKSNPFPPHSLTCIQVLP